MLKSLTPRLFLPKNDKELLKADVWPCDIVVDRDEKWVLTSEAVYTEFAGYIGFYSHHPKKR